MFVSYDDIVPRQLSQLPYHQPAHCTPEKFPNQSFLQLRHLQKVLLSPVSQPFSWVSNHESLLQQLTQHSALNITCPAFKDAVIPAASIASTPTTWWKDTLIRWTFIATVFFSNQHYQSWCTLTSGWTRFTYAAIPASIPPPPQQTKIASNFVAVIWCKISMPMVP